MRVAWTSATRVPTSRSALLYCFRDFFRETHAPPHRRSPALPRRALEAVARIPNTRTRVSIIDLSLPEPAFPCDQYPRGRRLAFPPLEDQPAASTSFLAAAFAAASSTRRSRSGTVPAAPPRAPPPPPRAATRRDAARDPRPVLAAPLDPRRRLRRRRSLGAPRPRAYRLLRRPSRANGRRARTPRPPPLRRRERALISVDGVPTPSVRFQATPPPPPPPPTPLLEATSRPPRRPASRRAFAEIRRPRGVVERRLASRRRNLLRHAHPRFLVRGRLARRRARRRETAERAARARRCRRLLGVVAATRGDASPGSRASEGARRPRRGR